MRGLMVQVPRGRGLWALCMASDHHGANLARWEAEGERRPLDLVSVQVRNDEVEGLLAELDAIDDAPIILVPRGTPPLQPPADQAAEQVTDAADCTPVEVLLSGLPSIGS